ncbi:UNVERIFIED_CONTAM: hypothetical protein RMT77_005504 [Armadillidium vulgare]
MQVLIFTLLFCCCYQVLGRPSDPVIREFGTQPNNPNVKVFSTYPTLKPPIIKDNPNDLEKGPDQEKYEKDEREVSESKGEEITKAESNLTDAEIIDEAENVTEENILEANSSAGELANGEIKDANTTSDNEMENENIEDVSQVSIEDGRSGNETMTDSSDDNIQETKNSNINPQVEIDADQNPESVIVSEMEGAVAPISESELLDPLVIDAPVTAIPAIAEELGEIPEEEILFAIPDMNLNDEEIYELNEQNPLLTTGVILPELVPMEAASDVGTAGEIIPLKIESTTLSPIIVEEVESNVSATAEFPKEESMAKQPVAEITGDVFEPMASLTEERPMLGATVEQEEPEPISFEPLGDFQRESVATEGNALENTPMEEGDLGVSVSMIEKIPPVVEVEPESPVEVAEEKLSSDVQVNEETNNDKSINKTLVEKPKDESIQMAGFMADASKTISESEQTTEEILPSATDLSLVLNITDTDDGGSSTVNNDTQVEPMDQLDVIDALQPASEIDSSMSPTTEKAMPTLNPMELTPNEDVNEDPTLNEAI